MSGRNVHGPDPHAPSTRRVVPPVVDPVVALGDNDLQISRLIRRVKVGLDDDSRPSRRGTNCVALLLRLPSVGTIVPRVVHKITVTLRHNYLEIARAAGGGDK
jgi:hypothetical protein